jgi:hemin uptake protein HemP
MKGGSGRAGRTGMQEKSSQDAAVGLSAQDHGSSAATPRIVSSADLFGGTREVIIRHVGEDYRLRLTRAGKLILNK